MKIDANHFYGVVGVLGVVLTVAVIYVDYDTSSESYSDNKKEEILAKINNALNERDLVISEPPNIPVENYVKPEKRLYELLEVSHVWDMRNWVRVDSVNMAKPVSPVTVIGRKKLRKLADTDEYVTSAMSSGYNVFTRCEPLQNKCKTLVDENRVTVGGTKLKSFHTIYDTSEFEINGEFDIKYTRTFWNGFQNRDQNWIGVIADAPIYKVTFLLILPDKKIMENLRLMVAKIGDKNKYEYSGEKLVMGDTEKKWMYWELIRPQEGHVYRIDWDWIW